MVSCWNACCVRQVVQQVPEGDECEGSPQLLSFELILWHDDSSFRNYNAAFIVIQKRPISTVQMGLAFLLPVKL